MGFTLVSGTDNGMIGTVKPYFRRRSKNFVGREVEMEREGKVKGEGVLVARILQWRCVINKESNYKKVH